MSPDKEYLGEDNEEDEEDSDDLDADLRAVNSIASSTSHRRFLLTGKIYELNMFIKMLSLYLKAVRIQVKTLSIIFQKISLVLLKEFHQLRSFELLETEKNLTKNPTVQLIFVPTAPLHLLE